MKKLLNHDKLLITLRTLGEGREGGEVKLELLHINTSLVLLIKCCYYYPDVQANLVPLLKYYPQLFIMNYEHVINGLKRGFYNFTAHAVLKVQQIWASSYYTNTENRFSIVNQKVSIIIVAVLYFNLCFSSHTFKT